MKCLSIPLLILAGLCSACQSGSAVSQSDEELNPIVSIMDSLKPEPTLLNWAADWTIDSVLVWEDKNGFNQAVLAHRVDEAYPGSMELEVRHYVQTDSGPHLMRKIIDFERECEFDNMAGYREGSVMTSDVDKDGFKELTFTYLLGCTSDVSPLPIKLLVLENGAKYIIRGTTRFPEQMGADEWSGKKEPDANFSTASAAIRQHMDTQWALHTVWP